jgi:hypothetical protein
MQKASFSWYILAVILAGSAVLAIDFPLLWSGSVDLAHHYTLIFRLSEHWSLAPHDPTLGEMNDYPRGSHLAAAFLARLVGSPFLGMHLVALTALVAVWASCIAIVYAAPGRTGPFNAIVMALVVVLNFGAFRIHGAEISSNYLFAQLVAQAFAMAVIAVTIRLDGTFGRYAAHAFLLAAIWLTTGIHLLPAVELLAVLAGLLALDVAVTPLPPRERLRRLLVACAILGIGIVLVVSHPAFAAMRNIANNNGELSLGPLKPLWSVGVMCIGALACSVSLVRAWQRDPVAYVTYKYLGVYGAAVSGLCLLQMVLVYFNIGSEYAAKKYAYAIVTFLFMRLALWLGSKLARAAATRPRFAQLGNHPAFAVLVFAVALFATSLGAAKKHQDVDTRAVVRLEHDLTHLPVTALPALQAGRQNLIVGLRGMPNVVNYMFSLSIAHTSREAALFVLRGQAPDAQFPAKQFQTVLTSRGNTRFANAAQCATAQGPDLVAMSVTCLDRPGGAAPANQPLASR